MDINYYKQYESIFGSWKITRLIGEGSFGKVFEMEREDFGVTFKAALKAITVPANESEVREMMEEDMDEASVRDYFGAIIRDLAKEFALMSKLKGNSNVVSCENHQVIEHKDGIGWDILIQMERLTPLNEYTRTHTVTRQDVIKLGIDLCKALELCRKYNIIHRDVKPENIFISDAGNFKLGDFGIARTMEKTTGGLPARGSSFYMAPEVYKGEPYDFTVDIYSLGLVLYRLLNGNRLPFLPAEPAPVTYADWENAQIRRFSGTPVPPLAHAGERLNEIVGKACAYDPGDRYTDPAQMRQDLEHVDSVSPVPPAEVPSGRVWPGEWSTGEIVSFTLSRGETNFTCDGSMVTMKLGLQRADRPVGPLVVPLTYAQREALWKQLESIRQEGWEVTCEQAKLLGAFDYEWDKNFQCELTGGRKFQYCSNGDVPPGFTALYEFLRNLVFPQGRCAEDAHDFSLVVTRDGRRSFLKEYLYCEDCGLVIPLLAPECYPNSRIQGVAYAWPAAWRAEDILRFSAGFGDRPIRYFTYDGGILTARNRIDVSRDGGMSFPPDYFDPVSMELTDGQKEQLYRCLGAIPREHWCCDHLALKYDLQCPTGYTRHSFFSCEMKDGGKFDYLPGEEAAPGFVQLCRCLEDILQGKKTKSEPVFLKRLLGR